MDNIQIPKFAWLFVFLPVVGLIAFLLIQPDWNFERTGRAVVAPTAIQPPVVFLPIINRSQATPMPIKGIGIMGDSNSDEYRADDNRGGKYAPTTLNWMEQLALKRKLNFGPWGTWGEPRRTGYEYNWARTGATAHSLITSGQHTGLAQQVAAGKVSHVLLYIGANDFHPINGTYKEIYDGTLDDAALQAKINGIVADITSAVDTVLSAGKVQIVIVNIGDPGVAPPIRARFPNSARRQRVTDAITAVNDGIRAMADARGIPFVDLTEFAVHLLARVDDDGFLSVSGEKIDLMTQGNEPHHMQLDDRSGHLGTVVSGLMANAIFVEPFNNTYGLEIEPLSDEELLQNAGIMVKTN